jgi:hypothetical protein
MFQLVISAEKSELMYKMRQGCGSFASVVREFLQFCTFFSSGMEAVSLGYDYGKG